MDSEDSVLCHADSSARTCTEHGCQLGLMQMPNEILEKILTYLTFDEISVCRQVFNAHIREIFCDIIIVVSTV